MNAQLKTQTPSIESMIDRFCELQNQITDVEPLIKERDNLRKQLAEYCDTVSPDAVKLTGVNSYMSFTKPPVMREIKDINGFFEAVGFEAFLASVKISTSAADKLLNETQKAKLFETSLGRAAAQRLRVS
jgi:hypothetical protein